MRKSIIAIISIFALECLPYGNIKIVKDDYKNQTTFTLDLHTTTNYTITDIGKAKALFLTITKTINAGSETLIKCYLSSQFSIHEQPLGHSGFFKLDDKKIIIKFQNTKIIPNSIRKSSLSTHSAEFVISNELKNDLLNANSLSVRFYSGELPFDADFSSSDLRVIKELINSNP
ncbi:hypothetical protein EHQ81_19435 [Leptospira selangorensis]|uniref:Uncharacterized protein n=1 Tax=Leptospira selangorensis TaxID=2484982 RepID=A0A5F2C6E6_9LEPT|nr:hypothetical protein [Leptospira selangorensis]TGM10281.1 hypothetical protein EHQ81_19435 [Leptospira selangorensis]TGM27943.1 hypothetical protein EHQ82_01615 [Leptospira selangorensis]